MKPRQVVPECRTGAPESELQAPDLPDPPLDAAPLDLNAIVIPRDRELWTSIESAAYLRFLTLNAFHCWVSRHRVPRERRGNDALYRQRDLDEALRKDRRRVVAERRLLVSHRRSA